ncbi:hypothetical protein MRX96_016170 [Rhipicephalus microplus]
MLQRTPGKAQRVPTEVDAPEDSVEDPRSTDRGRCFRLSREGPKSTERSRCSRGLRGWHEEYRPKSMLRRTPWKTRSVPTKVGALVYSMECTKSTDRSRCSRGLRGRPEEYRLRPMLQRTPRKARRVPTKVDATEDSLEDLKSTDQSRRSGGLRGRPGEYRQKSMLRRTAWKTGWVRAEVDAPYGPHETIYERCHHLRTVSAISKQGVRSRGSKRSCGERFGETLAVTTLALLFEYPRAIRDLRHGTT